MARQIDGDGAIAAGCESRAQLPELCGGAQHAVDQEGDLIALAPDERVELHQASGLADRRRWPRVWEAAWISGPARMWYEDWIAVSWLAYQAGSSVLARSRVWVGSTTSRRPMLRGIQHRACPRGASIMTSIGYFQPSARCSSTAANGSRSAGGVNSSAPSETLVILSTRRTRCESFVCDQHRRYQRPRRTTTAHGSTSIGHSSWCRRYWMVTRRRAVL